MFFKRLLKRIFCEEQQQLQPVFVQFSEQRSSFIAALNRWIEEYKDDDDALLLFDGDALNFLRAHAINFDCNSQSYAVVWDKCIVIGHTYTLNSRYVVLNKFMTTYPKHESVYANDKLVGKKVYIMQLSKIEQE